MILVRTLEEFIPPSHKEIQNDLVSYVLETHPCFSRCYLSGRKLSYLSSRNEPRNDYNKRFHIHIQFHWNRLSSFGDKRERTCYNRFLCICLLTFAHVCVENYIGTTSVTMVIQPLVCSIQIGRAIFRDCVRNIYPNTPISKHKNINI